MQKFIFFRSFELINITMSDILSAGILNIPFLSCVGDSVSDCISNNNK